MVNQGLIFNDDVRLDKLGKFKRIEARVWGAGSKMPALNFTRRSEETVNRGRKLFIIPLIYFLVTPIRQNLPTHQKYKRLDLSYVN